MTNAIKKHIDEVLLQNKKNRTQHELSNAIEDISALLSIFTHLQDGNETPEKKKEQIENFLGVNGENSLSALIERVQAKVDQVLSRAIGETYSINLKEELKKFADGTHKTMFAALRDMADVALYLIAEKFDALEEKYYKNQTSIQLSYILAFQSHVAMVFANADMNTARHIVDRMFGSRPSDADRSIIRLINHSDNLLNNRRQRSKLSRVFRTARNLFYYGTIPEDVSKLFNETKTTLVGKYDELGANPGYILKFEGDKQLLIEVADSYRVEKSTSISRNLNPRQSNESKHRVADLKRTLLTILDSNKECARDLCIWIMQGKEEWSKLGGNHQSENPRTRLVSLLCHQQRAFTELVKYPDSYYLVNDIANGTQGVEALTVSVEKRKTAAVKG